MDAQDPGDYVFTLHLFGEAPFFNPILAQVLVEDMGPSGVQFLFPIGLKPQEDNKVQGST